MRKNITLSVEERLVNRAREVAGRQGRSLNGLIRDFLATLVGEQDGETAADALFSVMDAHPGRSGGARICRDDIYEDRIG